MENGPMSTEGGLTKVGEERPGGRGVRFKNRVR